MARCLCWFVVMDVMAKIAARVFRYYLFEYLCVYVDIDMMASSL